jgi:hypothetical protein
VNRQLAAKATVVATTDAGKQVIISDGEHKELLQINPQSLATKTLVRDVASQPLWQPTGLVLYSTSATNPQYYVYNLSTHKAAAWKFAKNIYPGGDPVTLLDATTAIVADTNSHPFLVGKDLQVAGATN